MCTKFEGQGVPPPTSCLYVPWTYFRDFCLCDLLYLTEQCISTAVTECRRATGYQCNFLPFGRVRVVGVAYSAILKHSFLKFGEDSAPYHLTIPSSAVFQRSPGDPLLTLLGSVMVRRSTIAEGGMVLVEVQRFYLKLYGFGGVTTKDLRPTVPSLSSALLCLLDNQAR